MKKKIVIFILLIVLIILCGILIYRQTSKKENISEEVNEECLVINEIENQSQKINLSQTKSTNDLIVTANVTIQEGMEKIALFEWDIHFKYEDEGKNDLPSNYIYIEPSGNQCKVKCLKPFDKIIILECRNSYDKNISGSCELNYIKRAVKRTFDFCRHYFYDGEEDLYFIDFENQRIEIPKISDSNTFYDIGTKKVPFEVKYTYSISDELDFFLTDEKKIFPSNYNFSLVETDCFDMNLEALFGQIQARPEDDMVFAQMVYEYLPEFIKRGRALFYFNIYYYYNNISYSWFHYEIAASSWNYKKPITNITLNNNNIEF